MEMARPFNTVLIANRGEVAVRIIRACREVGLKTVLVYSDADSASIAVHMADQAVRIGPPPASASYLRGDAIVEAALSTGAQAIHPGFGFLSENAEFAEHVQAAGLIFIGPDPHAIRAMGLKTTAIALMQAAQVPTVPGYRDSGSLADMQAAAEEIGYPVMVKAAAGGGGKGMRIVYRTDQLAEAVESAQREALKAFADERIFLEKYLADSRHIEFQIFADRYGHTVHLFERECSIQRRHQKIIEESPSPYLTDVRPELRAVMGEAAVRAAQAVQYVNAGTVEFIIDPPTGQFYFLEMNTRLQVEHPVTEMVTGVDLVKLQLAIAAGEALPFTQEMLSQRGHAIECRVYAEDAANHFLPAIGPIRQVIEPYGPYIRIDAGITSGDEVTIHYDPMLAKLIVLGNDRAEAIQRMLAALNHYIILGLTTNIAFLQDLLRQPAFGQGHTTTAFIDTYMRDWQAPTPAITTPALAALALQEVLYKAAPTISHADADQFSPWTATDGFRLSGKTPD